MSAERTSPSVRIGNLELSEAATCGMELNICQWSDEPTTFSNGETKHYKWTIAYWSRTKEGFELGFVGSRPFDARVDWKVFGELARLGQKYADEVLWHEESRLPHRR